MNHLLILFLTLSFLTLAVSMLGVYLDIRKQIKREEEIKNVLGDLNAVPYKDLVQYRAQLLYEVEGIWKARNQWLLQQSTSRDSFGALVYTSNCVGSAFDGMSLACAKMRSSFYVSELVSDILRYARDVVKAGREMPIPSWMESQKI